MAKGGNQVQKSEVTQSNIPDYAKPYFMSLMQGAQGQLNAKYVPYERPRIADFTPEQRALQTQTAGLQTPGQFASGSDLATRAGLGSLEAGQYAPGQFSAQQFGAEQAQQYMSPYVQGVMDIQKREALRDAQKSQLIGDLGAARQGAYGGSRQLLAGMERERNLGTQMGDIQARGQQAAYENAQQQFERDRVAAMEAQRLGEQSRQFGAGQALAGYGQAGQMAQTLGNLGQYQQQADISRLGYQGQTAAQEQAMQQQYLDMRYQDFLRQRDYQNEQLQQYSSLLRGVPVTPSTTATTYAPTPGMGQQLLGTGLGAASVYKTFAGA